MPGAISQVFPKTEATSLSVCCVQMLPKAGEIQSGGGEAPLTALSLLTRSLQWDSLHFGPQRSELHLICLGDLATSEAIFTSLVKTVTPEV